MLVCSCKKFIEIPLPQNQILSQNLFSDDSTAKAAVNGLYSQIMRNGGLLLSGSLSIYPSLSSDEMSNTASNNAYDQFYANSLTAIENTQIYNGLWKWGYSFIYHANAVYEGLSNSSQINNGLRDQLIGEVKFIRALCYFYLLNLYGDIPLVINTNYQTNSIMPRTSVAEIYELIVSDLKEAQNALQNNYPSAGKVRVNKLAVTSFLARIYLYLKDWVNAEIQSSNVINSGMYTIVPNLTNVFKANSPETIFEFMPVSTTMNTYEGFIFTPSTGATVKPTFALSSILMNSFEPGDSRKTNWIKSKIISGTTYYYPQKYSVRSGGAPYSEYNIMFRLTEQYLIRAEARAHLNNFGGSQSDINIVRSRALLSNTSANTQSTLLLAIEQERQTEFFCELGHRWFDLKRTNRADGLLSVRKAPNWSTTDQLYPIPQNEIEVNPFLTQNPGY